MQQNHLNARFGSLVLIFLVIVCVQAYSQTGSVSGRVVDAEGPLPGASLRISGSSAKTYTDVDGRFVLLQLPAGTSTLVVQYAGMDSLHIQLVIPNGEAVDLGPVLLRPAQLGEVVVTADISGKDVKANLLSRVSPRPVSVLAAEGVGKLPDRNAAEAVQRLAGVVMERDQGEGRYVSFRGTPADWSSALINGDRMPAADEENRTRALNFDILPAGLIEYVIVSRALTPDLEGDAIGGSANFITRNAPRRRVVNGSFSYGYNQKSGKPVLNANVLWGDRSKNDRLGYLIGASFFQRNWGTDNYQVFYGGNFDHSINRLELRAYNGKRTTVGANAAVEYILNAAVKLYAKALYGSMDDNEYNRKMMFAYNPGIGQSIRLQNIHNILSSRFAGGNLGGSWQPRPGSTLTWNLATYHNRFQYGPVPFARRNDKRNGYYVIEFEKQVYYTDFLFLDDNGNPTDEINASYRYKLLDIDSPVPGYGDSYKSIQPTWRNIIPVTPTDTLFQFVKQYTETNNTRESDPVVVQLDFQRQLNNKFQWKTGLKYRIKYGERKVGLEVWERSPAHPQAIVYDEFKPQPVDRRLLPEVGSTYSNLFASFFSDQTIADFHSKNEYRFRYLPFGVNTPYYDQFVGSSYSYREDVAAAYGMVDAAFGSALQLNAGVRAEYTRPRVDADSVIEDIATSNRYLINRAAGRNYWAVLPMLNLRYAFTEYSLLRLAATRSFRRPNFNEIKPGQPAIDYTNFELILGNPDLKPSFSWNFDLAYERYLKSGGLLSLSAYYKYVTDHIYTAFESSSADNNGVANQFQTPGGVVAKKYQNAPRAYAAGLELAFNSKFWFLNGFWQHFGLNANLTYTASAMEIAARERPQPLPRQSKYLANLALFFEQQAWNIRLALNYKAPYLYELNLYAVKDPVTGRSIVVHQNNDYDVYVGQNLTLDAAVSYRFAGRWSVFAEANNLTNTPLVIYRGKRERPVKTEYYGVRGLAGLRYSF